MNVKYELNRFTKVIPRLQFDFSDNIRGNPYFQNVDSEAKIRNRIWCNFENSLNGLHDSLKEGQVIRIGSQFCIVQGIFDEIKIKAEVHSQQNKTSAENLEGFKEQSYSIDNKDISKDYYHCRICAEGPSFKNPFIFNLCNCKTSTIHLSCLKEWVTSKSMINEYKNMKYFCYSNLECEICKKKLPATITIEDKKVHLINYVDGKSKSILSLVMIQGLTETESGNLVFYFDDSNDCTLKVGKTQINDIIFQGYGVSDENSLVARKSGRYYIIDLNSKYGSQKLMDDKTEILKNIGKNFYYNSFVFSFHLNDSKTFCPCSRLKASQINVDCNREVLFLRDQTHTISSAQELNRPNPTPTDVIANPPNITRLIYSKQQIKEFYPPHKLDFKPRSSFIGDEVNNKRFIQSSAKIQNFKKKENPKEPPNNLQLEKKEIIEESSTNSFSRVI